MTNTESNPPALPEPPSASTESPQTEIPVSSEAQPVSASDSAAHPALSKKAQKRLLKAERFAATKAEWRAREKEKKREKKAKRKAEAEAANDGESPAKKRRVVATLPPKILYRARVVIDLGFDDLMSEKEVVSLTSQLAYSYNSNRRSRTPFESILCTTLNGKTLKRLQVLGNQHERWRHVQFWEKGYEHLWEGETTKGVHEEPRCPKENVVYLTGDSEEEIHELKEGETYIIGGICDHNRYKSLCLNKAESQSIRHARLPIGTYLKDFPTRKILTVNQVFDILLHWAEHRNWEKALYAVMPKRKFHQGGQKTVEGDADQAADTDENTQVHADGEADAEGST
ncbi:guanine-1-methyltransferase-domain-containing protein [Hysterangium stoloniferum]|nr:guanine-1-methyltransferase-domain-containing protein [Hysterangium stoloniferum]